MDTSDLLGALQELEKRADRVSDQHVFETYVDTGSLANALGTSDNGILYGRRGTGKTHALKYLAEVERKKSNFVVYIDMEQDLGSTEGLYVDRNLGVAERATRLLVDVIGIIHSRLLEDAFAGMIDGNISLLDRTMDHFTEVVVVREAEQELSSNSEYSSKSGFKATASSKSIGVDALKEESDKASQGNRVKTSGAIRHRVHFGAVSKLLREVLENHEAKRCWFLFDEWSGVPLDLQPYLAEMLRKLFFGIPKVTVRVAAIPHRTEWRIAHAPGDYVGLELGAEIFPILDLDEFVVFPARSREEQSTRAQKFFRTLLFKHLSQALLSEGKEAPASPDQLVSLLFTQITALQEMIRAAEGVPRDALNIVSRAALRAGESRIATDHIRSAAAQLYQTTKAAQLNSAPLASSLLSVIISDVISGRKARAFLLLQEHANHPLVQQLVDDRILHVIKKGYSSKDDVGERFDVLQIDYGCYVHLLKTTSSAPQGLFGVDSASDDSAMAMFYTDGEVEVPEDDYRAIRRAVLDLPSKLEQIGASFV